MHESVIGFLKRIATEQRVSGARVLEVGAYNVNGSPREVLEPLGPASYIGVDLEPQDRFVDQVLNVENLSSHFGQAAFDVVVCTEMLEHVEDWKTTAEQLDAVLVPGGLLIATTRSEGFPVHGYPSDHWRYTPEDLGAMFNGYRVLHLSDDTDASSPGVLFAGIKQPEAIPARANPSPVEVPYHSELAHCERQRLRKATPKIPDPIRVFYHVACMGSWRSVFDDQMQLFAQCDLVPDCHVVGALEDFEYVRSRIPDARYHGSDLALYETPTLQAAYEWACENPAGAVIYLHTKGVSQPKSVGKQAWRILMEEGVIRDWQACVRSLTFFDMVGVNWMPNPDYPHYCGNFWAARCDWLASLDSPTKHRTDGGPWIAGNPWDRMHAEMWLGSRPWHCMKTLIGQGECLWETDRVFELLENRGRNRLVEFVGRDPLPAGFCASEGV